MSLAARGRIRVPAFQRSFVWDASDIRKLFDSIWRGFPIGTLLLWRREAPAERVEFGPVAIDAPAFPDALWVVDGQQRVTSLVGALTADPAGVDHRFELCFDLRRATFVHAGRRPLPPWWLPLRVSLESRTLIGWVREHGDELVEDELNLADALGGVIRDYRIQAYIVEHDDDDLLREVFDRVNSAGKPISRAQVFHALFGGSTESASTSGVIASLQHEGFGVFDEQRVVQSLLAIRGGDVNRDLHNEFAPNEDRQTVFDDTERALSRVIRFLRQQGVPHLQLVPYTLPVPVLAAFFHLHPHPDPWNERLLARWLWRGWTHGYGRSGPGPALRQAVRAVHPKRGRPEDAPAEHDAVKALLALVEHEGPSSVDARNFRTDTAAGRLALLALASLEPRGPDGEPLELEAEFQEHGVAAVTELVPGFRAALGARALWPAGHLPPAGQEDPHVLASHAIDEVGASALRDHDFQRFVIHRGQLVTDLVHRFLAARVEQGAIVRPPLTDLLVPDDDIEVTTT